MSSLGDTLHILWIIQILTIWGTSIDNNVGFLDIFFILCLSVSLCLCICLQYQVLENLQLLTSSFIYGSLVSGLEL